MAHTSIAFQHPTTFVTITIEQLVTEPSKSFGATSLTRTRLGIGSIHQHSYARQRSVFATQLDGHRYRAPTLRNSVLRA